MTSQDRGNLMLEAHRIARRARLNGEDYERALERAEEKSAPEPVRENA